VTSLSPRLLVASLFLFAALAIGLFFHASYENQARHVAHQNSIALNVAYRSTISMYRLDVETRFKNQVLRDEVLGLLQQANDATADELPLLRGWLYRMLHKEYQDMVRTGLRQFHFHLPDGRSLLRFHSPAHLGDASMFDIRPSLRIANTELRPVVGFEGGRVLPGFRNVYPIIRAGRHLGSVELSLPFERIHQNLSELLPAGDYALLLHRSTVDLVFEDQRDKFVTAEIHPDYRKENPVISQVSRKFVQSPRAKLLNTLLRENQQAKEGIRRQTSFSVPILHDGKGYIASFHAIKDLQGKQAAYLVGYTEAPVLIDIQSNEFRQFSMALVLLVTLTLSVWGLIHHRQRLAAERNRLQTITETLSDGIYVIDAKGKICFTNQAACELTEYTRDELLGQVAHDLIHEHTDTDEPAQTCPINTAAQTGECYSGETWFTSKSGRHFPVEVSCRPMRESDMSLKSRMPPSSVLVFRDITAERAALERMRLQSVALDATANAIVITDADSLIEWVNPAFTTLTGYPLDEAIGKRPKELVRSGLQPIELYQVMWQTILAGSPWRGEVVNRKKDGTLYHEDLTITPVLDTQGTLKHFIAIKQDITARKQEEAAAQRARLEIERLSAHNELLLNSAGDGIYGTDANGLCIFVNPAALAMLGYQKEDLLNRDQHAVFHHHHRDGQPYPHVDCPIYQTLQDGLNRDVEDAFINKNGKIFDVHLSITAIEKEGQRKGVVVVFQDITQRKRMEVELNRLATTDTLTGIANRRHFMAQFALELERVRRYKKHSSVLMLDLDHFKQVNDRHGHATGDAVLRHFSELTRQHLRKVDVFGRLGGEEFGILLPDTDYAGAYEFAERLRKHVATSPCVSATESITYTVSIGITTCDHDELTADHILAKADQALYQAKSDGRNQTVIMAASHTNTDQDGK
jgi:diguanylate cyclase (GGDEF)-like protein/PAS domain S-box-containing protein